MNLRLVLTGIREEDLVDIDAQTIELFGLLQAERTTEEIEKAFDLLCENPRIGRLREDLSPKNRKYRIWVVLGRLVIIYERLNPMQSQSFEL
ncbi:MAG: type II toxin-antitoxin system RelE/ParE family toxin [Candidatus Omnitrophica bacterium]|nr:type II toxin-antitoxin system RelE/ParE family toxin [Candidatus Omnitrophota bacterium]